MSSPVACTPNMVYFKNDVCILCGFSFGLREVTSKGEIKERDQKGNRWPVTVERLEKIKKVNLNNFDSDTTVQDLFDFVVCSTCFNKVENVLNYENEIIQLKLDLTQSRENAKQLLSQPQKESSPNSLGSPSSESPVELQVTFVQQENSPGSPSSKSPVELQETIVQQESSPNSPGSPSSESPVELQVTFVQQENFPNSPGSPSSKSPVELQETIVQQESSPNSPGSPSSESPVELQVTFVQQENSPNSPGLPSSKSPVELQETLMQQESSPNSPGSPSSKSPVELQVTLVPHVLAKLPQQTEPVPVFVMPVPEQEKETDTKGIITFMIII
ncbi:hypothetical protein SNE40_006910 [Patella caerulea]|uniref:Uncharacterized protein n=1 Tax=Patella caerulea TaxID=87958 RepID=A0AAN8PT24_PATCE